MPFLKLGSPQFEKWHFMKPLNALFQNFIVVYFSIIINRYWVKYIPTQYQGGISVDAAIGILLDWNVIV